MANEWLFSLGLGALASMAAIAWMFVRYHARRVGSLTRALVAERLEREQMARDLSALIACSKELGDRLKSQAAKQKSMVERVNEIAQQVDNNQALSQAERLVNNGLAVAQVSELCALSKGEAALLERWRRKTAA